MAIEDHDGYKVAQSHQRHGQVSQGPGQVQGDEGSAEYHPGYQDAVAVQHPFFLRDEADIGLAVVVVSYHAAECEHEDGQGDEYLTYGAYLCRQGGLGELDAVDGGVADSAYEDDEGGAGADDQSVGEDSEGLDESLFYGVGGVCGCGHVRSRAHAVPESECIGDDQAQHLRYFIDIHGYDDKRQGDVEKCHHGDQQAAHAGDAPDAAEDDHEGQDGEDYPHPLCGHVEGQFPRGADGIALH